MGATTSAPGPSRRGRCWPARTHASHPCGCPAKTCTETPCSVRVLSAFFPRSVRVLSALSPPPDRQLLDGHVTDAQSAQTGRGGADSGDSNQRRSYAVPAPPRPSGHEVAMSRPCMRRTHPPTGLRPSEARLGIRIRQLSDAVLAALGRFSKVTARESAWAGGHRCTRTSSRGWSRSTGRNSSVKRRASACWGRLPVDPARGTRPGGPSDRLRAVQRAARHGAAARHGGCSGAPDATAGNRTSRGVRGVRALDTKRGSPRRHADSHVLSSSVVSGDHCVLRSSMSSMV